MDNLGGILQEMAKAIETLGFSRRGAYLHRPSRDRRARHVVLFQEGKSHLAGKFTVAMGTFLPSVYVVRRGQKAPANPDISKCQIVSRLSTFAGAGDIWWDKHDEGAAADLIDVIKTEIPRFFNEWGDVQSILHSWRGEFDPSRVRVSNFAIAAILHEEKFDEEAQSLLSLMEADLRGTNKDINAIKEFASRLGIVPTRQ